jgi:hypothetical protein
MADLTRNVTNPEHPAVAHLLHYLEDWMVGNGTAHSVAEQCAELAVDAVAALPTNPELTAGLRKLLEARDCFVRAAQAWTPDEKS